MELILLFIIIGYILSRVARFFIKGRKLYKELGYKRVTVLGYSFIVRKLIPLDFHKEKYGLPLTFFKYKKQLTLMQQAEALSGGDEETKAEDIKQSIELAKKVIEAGLVSPIIKVNDFFDNTDMFNVAWGLYGEIIAHSFKTLSTVYELDEQYSIHIGELCKRINKKPSEHLAGKDVSVVEAYMIDEFIGNILIKNENELNRKKNIK